MKKLLAIVAVILSLNQTKAQVNDTLFINNGIAVMDSFGSYTFPYLTFNSGSAFNQQNTFHHYDPGTVVNLTVVNNDSIPHNIDFNKGQLSWGIISPRGTSTLTISNIQNGVYEISDNSEPNRFLGLSTFLVFWPRSQGNFYWHLNEHESSINQSLRQGIPFDADTFFPDFFTVNDLVHPQVMTDSLASVTGSVGDSILIFVHNSGKMHHSVHFHGYHVHIIYSNGDPVVVGRSKDTIPIRPSKSQVYLLVPFQHGIYPVHDHNLVATTGGGNYPNGMIVMMNISP